MDLKLINKSGKDNYNYENDKGEMMISKLKLLAFP